MNRPHDNTDPWAHLKTYTEARIAMGRAGVSTPTRDLLAFKLDHARARDAVHIPFNDSGLSRDLSALHTPVVRLSSRAPDRQTFLRRPDLGRKLSPDSAQSLAGNSSGDHDICIVISEGLSAIAIEENAYPLLMDFIPRITSHGFSLAPLVIVSQGRVAVGDDVCRILKARMVIVLIGERPGLSSPDSMGIYMTYMPEAGTRDDKRNCISNVRTQGLPPAMASAKLEYLVRESLRLKLSGVSLKDRQDTHASISS